MRLNGVIAVVLVVTMTSLCTGCFAPVRPVNQDWRFGQISQAVNEENEPWLDIDFSKILVAVFALVALSIIVFCMTISGKSGKHDGYDISNSSNNLTYAVCDHWEKCGKWGRKGCLLYHSSVIQSKECLEKQLVAGCGEYNSKVAEYHDICWPRCKPGPEKCEGRRRLICDDGRLVVVDCVRWCDSKGKGYAGICKEMPNGKARCECR